MGSIADNGFTPFSFSQFEDEDLRSEGEHSSCSESSEGSTNATRSDLVGAGRLVGKAYSRAGRALETGLGKAIHAIRSRRTRKPSSDSTQSNAMQLQVLSEPSKARGEEGRRATTARTGPSIRHAFSFSTVSSDKTETNIPGTGRVLGNLYTAGGKALESYMNKRAIRAGRGPEASAKRIRQHIIGEPYPDELLLYLQVKTKGREEHLFLENELVLYKECLRLLGYVK